MDLNTFDAVILGIVLIFAIKGFFSGFVKEISGLLGIVLGIYLGSIYYKQFGEYIDNNIFKISNESAIGVIGFIGVFVLTWLIVFLIGLVFEKIIETAQLGLIDKLGGILFSGGKIFVIIAVIVTLMSQIEALHKQMEKWTKNSLTYPYLLETGEFLIKFNPDTLKEKIEEKKEDKSPLKEKINEVSEKAKEKIEKTTNKLNEKVNEVIEKNLSHQKGD